MAEFDRSTPGYVSPGGYITAYITAYIIYIHYFYTFIIATQTYYTYIEHSESGYTCGCMHIRTRNLITTQIIIIS